MRAISILILASIIGLFSDQSQADGKCDNGYTTISLMRNDLVTIKKNVQAMADALGSPSAPYAKESENWQLPTYACQDKSGFTPVYTNYTSRFTTDAQQKTVAADYQKKIMGAEAKGDMQEVMNITQQYQKMAMQQASTNQNNSPIEININTNNGDSMTIDPGAVARDGTGFIAIRQPGDASSGTETVNVYFDKLALKNAHELASFDESGNIHVPAKLAIINARISINGPNALVESMVKNLKASAVLSQLSETRTQIKD